MEINTMSSWGLSKAIYDIIENGFAYDEETGEIYFDGSNLDELKEALDTKLNSICGFIKMTDSQAEQLKARKKEIEDNIKYYENRSERLKNFLSNLMQANNIDKRELADYRLSTRLSTKVEIEDEKELLNYLNNHQELKEKCLKVETKQSFVKTELKKAFATNEVAGAKLVETKNLQIK